MTLMRCRVHGFQPGTQVCEHVDAGLRSGQVIPRAFVIELEVCEECMRRHDLGRFADEERFPYWSEAAEAAYRRASPGSASCCAECIAAAELAFARTNGLPDPFAAYERTLTALDEGLVVRLRTDLLAAFSFERSLVEPEQAAVWVAYGGLTYPLEIKIYYVVERAQQDAILGWLDRFSEDIPKRQRRVVFIRAENWQRVAVRPPAIDGHRRGPEQILRVEEVDPPGADQKRS